MVKLLRSLFEAHRTTVLQFLRFGTIGFFGFFVDLCFLHVALDVLGLNHYVAALFSFPFALIFNWLGNRYFTFRGKHTGSMRAQLTRFAAVCCIGLVLNRGTYWVLTATVPLVYQYPSLGLIGGTGAGMFFNFFFSKKLVFK